MKKHYLSVAVAMVLVGCGGSDGSDDTPVPSVVAYQGKLLDSQYIAGAEVCLDFDAAEACSSGFSGSTDSDGAFEIEVPESSVESARELKVTAVLPGKVAAARSVADAAAPAYTLITSADDNEVIVSPFTTQVADKIKINSNLRSALPLETQIALAKKDVINQNDFDDIEEDEIFGDYVGKQNGNLRDRAEKAAAWQARAALLRAQYVSNGALKEWDSVDAFVWNVWQHAYHTNRYFERYEEYVMLSRDDGTTYEERFEGSQWMVDENGDQIPGAKLQDYAEQSSWGDGEVSGYTYFVFDYDQDGVFAFEGERAFTGNYERNEQGLLSVDLLEFYNEGNPLVEGGHNEDGREFCPDFDITGLAAGYQEGDVLPSCVDFVQGTTRSSTTSDGDLFTEEQARFYFKRDDSVDMNFVAYYEEREFMNGVDGELGTNIYKDWDAKTFATEEVQPYRFNEVAKNYVDADGFKTQESAGANWTDRSPYFAIEKSPLRLFTQVNYASWGSYAPAFVHETHQELADKELFSYFITPINYTNFYDPKGDRTIAWNTASVDENGERLVFAKLDSAWDELNGVYEETLVLSPILDSASYEMNSEDGPVSEVVVSTELTYQSLGSVFADKSVAVGGEPESAVTFTPAIYSEQEWAVSSDIGDNDLFEYLFGDGSAYVFTKERSFTKVDGSGLCGSETDTTVNTQLMSEYGGDMVFTLYCNEWWIDSDYYTGAAPSQWVLQDVNVLGSDSFTAKLNAYANGANVFTDEPMASHEITFSR